MSLVYDIKIKVEFDWGIDGSFTDESAYLISARGVQKIASPRQSVTGNSGRTGECSLTLSNATGRFSSLNSGGAIYSSIGNGKMYQVPVKVSVSAVEAGDATNYNVIFRGVARVPEEDGLAPDEPSTIVFDCRTIEDVLLNRRIRTSQSDFKALVDTPVTEDQVIDAILTDSGTSLTSTLDSGLFALPFPWMNNEPITEELWRIAAACGGRFISNPDGELLYQNATNWITSTRGATSQKDFDRLLNFSRISISWDETELAETVTVSYEEREMSELDTLFDSKFFTVEDTETEIIWAELSSPVYEITEITTEINTPGGTPLTGVTVTPTYYAQAVKFSIANASGYQANVRIVLTGYDLTSRETKTLEQESADSFWTAREGRTRKISGNKWLQTRSQARMLRDFLSERQETPSLIVRLGGCPGDPTLRLGDRVTVEDSSLYLTSTDFYLIGITWRYTARGGYIQDLEGIRCTDLYPAVDDPGYFILDTHEIAGDEVVFF